MVLFPAMVRAFYFFLATMAGALLAKAELLPTTVGTTWEYEVAGGEDGETSPSTLTVRIHGKEKNKGRELLRFDTLSGDDLLKAELLAVNENSIRCYERTSSGGNTVPFDPPQTIVPATLKIGAKWENDDVVNGTEMHQQFTLAAEEEIEVPAGKFRAYRFHCEQPWPMSIAIERWFVPGTGFVKEVITTRGPTGRLVNRASMSLTKLSVQPIKAQPPAVEISATPSPSPRLSRISLEVAKEREGEAATEFRSNTPELFVRWSGENLPLETQVRIVWIAEDVGDVAEPNFVVDETRATIDRPDYAARFTLSRPKDGWAPGKYRVELYLNDNLAAKVAVTIRE